MPRQYESQLSDWLDAISHDLRRAILAYMWRCHPTPRSPVEIANELGAPLSDVSYHMRRLRHHHHEVIKVTKTRDVRGSVQKFHKLEQAFRDEVWVAEVLSAEERSS